jgi:hypothetical protein
MHEIVKLLASPEGNARSADAAPSRPVSCWEEAFGNDDVEIDVEADGGEQHEHHITAAART